MRPDSIDSDRVDLPELAKRLVDALPTYAGLTFGVVCGQLILDLWSAITWPHLWYAALLVVTYAALFVLPLVLLALLALLVTEEGAGRSGQTRWTTAQLLLIFVAWLLASALQIGLDVDRILFSIFAFHLNGFVWNLVTTAGGLESMGGSAGSDWPFALRALGWGCLQLALLAVADAIRAHRKSSARHRSTSDSTRGRRRGLALAAAALLFATTVERVSFGWSDLTGASGIPELADRIPFHRPFTFHHLATVVGIKAQQPAQLDASLPSSSRIRYPLRPVQSTRPERLPNIVILVCESWRADALTPGLMPATWAMAEESRRFTHHYSGGNGTRIGMFTLFYGLYGDLWHAFMFAEEPPLLIRRVTELDYELSLQTSSRFTYPEFDKTVFAGVPSTAMHVEPRGATWERDRRNMSRFEKWLDRRDATRPFLFFQFYESTHARYEFPDESIIVRPYLDSLSYATMNLERDMPLIRNRYLNSVHHLDSQLERVFAALKARGLWENTVVIVTGDHGEEFMEKGHWGHNSFFTEEQLRVPLLLHVPGETPQVIDRLTSHLDLAATLLPMLGVQNAASDYSEGTSLLSEVERPYAIFADWDHLGVLLDGYKFRIPIAGVSHARLPVTLADDAPVEHMDAIVKAHAPRLVRIMRDARRFLEAAESSPPPSR